MKYLVIGGAGSRGSALAKALLEKGHEVVVYDNLSTGKSEALHKGVRFHMGDIRDLTLLNRVLKDSKVDGVFHFAELRGEEASRKDPLSFYETNVFGQHNVLRAMINNGVKPIVYLSRTEKEAIPYFRTKQINEDMLLEVSKAHDVKYAILCLSENFQNLEELLNQSLLAMENIQKGLPSFLQSLTN